MGGKYIIYELSENPFYQREKEIEGHLVKEIYDQVTPDIFERVVRYWDYLLSYIWKEYVRRN